ncbi:hypothetical protein V1477_007628 [Vespula maculifrons]|uniref:Uncharacterized protein n=1 Tax=Vespula maculifrons TaxID=7453 RepID=A0ABD2CIV6_VESMC
MAAVVRGALSRRCVSPHLPEILTRDASVSSSHERKTEKREREEEEEEEEEDEEDEEDEEEEARRLTSLLKSHELINVALIVMVEWMRGKRLAFFIHSTGLYRSRYDDIVARCEIIINIKNKCKVLGREHYPLESLQSSNPLNLESDLSVRVRWTIRMMMEIEGMHLMTRDLRFPLTRLASPRFQHPPHAFGPVAAGLVVARHLKMLLSEALLRPREKHQRPKGGLLFPQQLVNRIKPATTIALVLQDIEERHIAPAENLRKMFTMYFQEENIRLELKI